MSAFGGRCGGEIFCVECIKFLINEKPFDICTENHEIA